MADRLTIYDALTPFIDDPADRTAATTAVLDAIPDVDDRSKEMDYTHERERLEDNIAHGIQYGGNDALIANLLQTDALEQIAHELGVMNANRPVCFCREADNFVRDRGYEDPPVEG